MAEIDPLIATVGTILFIIGWLLIVRDTWTKLPLGRPMGALFTAALFVLTGILSPTAAFEAISLGTLTLLFSMMFITQVVEEIGGFVILTRLLTGHTSKNISEIGFMIRTSLVGAVSAALVTNDTTCLFLTSIVCRICTERGWKVAPHLLVLATSSNIGAACTPIGSPQNIIIAAIGQVKFLDFLRYLLPATVIGLILNLVLIVFLFRHDLSADKPSNTIDQIGSDNQSTTSQVSSNIDESKIPICSCTDSDKNTSIQENIHTEFNTMTMSNGTSSKAGYEKESKQPEEHRCRLSGSKHVQEHRCNPNIATTGQQSHDLRSTPSSAMTEQEQHSNRYNSSPVHCHQYSSHTNNSDIPPVTYDLQQQGTPRNKNCVSDDAAGQESIPQGTISNRYTTNRCYSSGNHVVLHLVDSKNWISQHSRQRLHTYQQLPHFLPLPMISPSWISSSRDLNMVKSSATNTRNSITNDHENTVKVSNNSAMHAVSNPSCDTLTNDDKSPANTVNLSTKCNETVDNKHGLANAFSSNDNSSMNQTQPITATSSHDNSSMNQRHTLESTSSYDDSSMNQTQPVTAPSSKNSSSMKQTHKHSTPCSPSTQQILTIQGYEYHFTPTRQRALSEDMGRSIWSHSKIICTNSEFDPNFHNNSIRHRTMAPYEEHNQMYEILHGQKVPASKDLPVSENTMIVLDDITPSTYSTEQSKHSGSYLFSRFRFRALCLCTFLLLPAMIAADQHMGLAWTAAFGAIVLAILRGKQPEAILVKVDAQLLLFFSSLFVFVRGFSETGLPKALWDVSASTVGSLDNFTGIALFAAVVVFGSNTVSNVPLVLLLAPEITRNLSGHDALHAWIQLSWLSTIGGNLTLVGSVANLIVAERAKQWHTLGFMEYLKLGIPSTLILMLVGSALIYLACSTW